jgi:DNA ligase D-like protein (predicted 3'-phosphoesterase)
MELGEHSTHTDANRPGFRGTLNVIGSEATQKATMPALSIAIFVVKEHWARSLHFDFRLEKDGVFKSWAVPKGLPEKPGLKRLAVQVEDHALEFGQCQETIPGGEYVVGRIKVWDHGTMSSKNGRLIASFSRYTAPGYLAGLALFVSTKVNL